MRHGSLFLAALTVLVVLAGLIPPAHGLGDPLCADRPFGVAEADIETVPPNAGVTCGSGADSVPVANGPAPDRSCANGSGIYPLAAVRRDSRVTPTVDVCEDQAEMQRPPKSKAEDWAAIRASDVAKIERGWTVPRRIGVNTAEWEDSPYLTPNGRHLYYAVYPGEDLLTDFEHGTFVGDIDVYRTDAPFHKRSRDTRFFLSEPVTSAAGPMSTSSGVTFYHSNREGLSDGTTDADIYRNSTRLAFNDERESGNPHYCAARDELWYDIDDVRIWVLENAAQRRYRGRSVQAPAPVNLENGDSRDFQPWLDAKCTTMYFTSTRDDYARIYRSRRRADGSWSRPTTVVRSNFIVGEFSLSADGRTLAFLQVFTDGEGNYRSDIFLSRRVR